MLQVSKHSQYEPGDPRGSRTAVEIGGVQVTERQATYIREIAHGTKGPVAAELAGFSCPDQEHWRLSKDSKVQHAVISEIHRLATMEAAPLAYRAAKSMIEDDATPPGVRWKVSQWFMETAGIRPQPSGDGRDGQGRALEDLTLAELESIASQARKRLETIPAIEGEARTVEQHRQQQTRRSDPIEQAAKPAMAGDDPLD